MASDSFFIVVEGMDGSGKTGITRQMRAVLSHTHGDRVALTFEPHDPSAAGLYIRNALTKRIKVDSISLALAFALNRADHNSRIIDPFLSSDKPSIMISDRYTLSSLVYQSTGGLTMEDVYHLNQWARKPDLTIFLNVSPHNCYERMRNRPQDKELFEKNLRQRFDKYQEGMTLLRNKGETVVEVDANPPFPDVLANVIETVKTHAPAWVKIQPPLLGIEPIEIDNDLPQTQPDDLKKWYSSLTPADILTLSATDLNLLFKAYLLQCGFDWGERLTWTEAHAYELSYDMPLGLTQTGIALIIDPSQQADTTTKVIQKLLDTRTDEHHLLRLSDFVIILDHGRYEPLQAFDREGSSGYRISPKIQIFSRELLAQHK